MGGEHHEWYFKTEAEMRALFPDCPDAFDNTVKIANMCDLTIHQYSTPELKGTLPRFELPKEFQIHEDYTKNQDEYLLQKSANAANTKWESFLAWASAGTFLLYGNSSTGLNLHGIM